MIVDSFEQVRVPVALRYLDSIQVNPDRVKVLVVTHFDKDHYVGIDKLHDRCRNARLMVTAALSKDMFHRLFGDTAAQPALGVLPGTIERAAKREIAPSVMSLRYLSAGTKVLVSPNVAEVVALSPTDAATHQSNLELAAAIGADRAAVTLLLKDDNRCSVVLSVQLQDGRALLLAADLVADQPAFGWHAVVSEPNNATLSRADLVKVPHHGGVSAHDVRMWEQLVEERAVLLVAPYSPSGLPRPSDVARLCAMGHQLWQTTPSTSRFVTDEFGNQRERVSDVGMIRARRDLGDAEWRVTVVPPAFRACP